jgi:hypothetical protein
MIDPYRKSIATMSNSRPSDVPQQSDRRLIEEYEKRLRENSRIPVPRDTGHEPHKSPPVPAE